MGITRHRQAVIGVAVSAVGILLGAAAIFGAVALVLYAIHELLLYGLAGL